MNVDFDSYHKRSNDFQGLHHPFSSNAPDLLFRITTGWPVANSKTLVESRTSDKINYK